MTIDELINSLNILNSYVKDSEDAWVEAQHDVIMVGPNLKKVSETDAIILKELGWIYSDEDYSWIHYT